MKNGDRFSVSRVIQRGLVSFPTPAVAPCILLTAGILPACTGDWFVLRCGQRDGIGGVLVDGPSKVPREGVVRAESVWMCLIDPTDGSTVARCTEFTFHLVVGLYFVLIVAL